MAPPDSYTACRYGVFAPGFLYALRDPQGDSPRRGGPDSQELERGWPGATPGVPNAPPPAPVERRLAELRSTTGAAGPISRGACCPWTRSGGAFLNAD